MPNTTVFETKFSKRMQVAHYKKDVYRAFVNMEERATLTNGQSVVRPYRSTLTPQLYTRGSDLTFQDTTDTAETLTVSTSPAVPFTVDDLDELQSKYDLQKEYAEDAARKLGNIIDGDVLAEALNATSVVDAADFGGTSGNPIAVSTSNVLSILFAAGKKLNTQNIAIDNRFSVLSPQFMQSVQEYWAGRETVGGDEYGKNGFQGRMASAELYMSNNTLVEAVLGLATAPTNGDTLTINGVTFTFVSSIGTTPGNVLIGSADVTRANLVALINAPGTTTANGVALSAANQALFFGVSAVNDNSANTATIYFKGASTVSLSETLTDATDTWGSVIQHNLFGRKGAIDLVIQKEPTVAVDRIPKQLGAYIKPYTLYGKKTFREGAQALVDIKIDASLF